MKAQRISSAAFGLTLLFGMIGCGGAAGDVSGEHDPALVATWLATSISTQNPNASPANCQPSGASLPTSGGGTTECTAEDLITFNANGTWVNSDSEAGTWSSSGNKLTINVPGSASEVYTYSAGGSTATFTRLQNGTTVILTVTKE